MTRDDAARDAPADAPPTTAGHVVEDISLELEGTRWRIVLQLMADHTHHLRIERDGHLAVENVGSLPWDWPGAAFPPEVRDAIAALCEEMSWS